MFGIKLAIILEKQVDALPFNGNESAITEMAQVFSDPTRVRMLALLTKRGDSGATTLDISTTLDILQPRVSSHLAILRKSGMVTAAYSGRQRIYKVNSAKVDPILRVLSIGSGHLKRRKEFLKARKKESRVSPELRQCRSCYDHLAGIAGVQLLREMLRLGWLKESKMNEKSGRINYELTQSGLESFKARNVNAEKVINSSRSFAYGCTDWTEREPHLAGSLGAAMLASLFSNRTLERIHGTRALKMLRPISSWIDN